MSVRAALLLLPELSVTMAVRLLRLVLLLWAEVVVGRKRVMVGMVGLVVVVEGAAARFPPVPGLSVKVMMAAIPLTCFPAPARVVPVVAVRVVPVRTWMSAQKLALLAAQDSFQRLLARLLLMRRVGTVERAVARQRRMAPMVLARAGKVREVEAAVVAGRAVTAL